MKNKITKVIAVCLVCLSLFSMSAFALTSYQDYLVDVPAVNGSVETSTQIKTKTGYSGNIDVYAVGGGKKLDCRMRNADKSAGAWVNNITTGSQETLLSRASHVAGNRMHVYFSNKLTTVVAVTTSGSWRCDS